MRNWYKHAFVFSIVSITSPIITLMIIFASSIISLLLVGGSFLSGEAPDNPPDLIVLLVISIILIIALIIIGLIGLTGSILNLTKKRLSKARNIVGVVCSSLGITSTALLIYGILWLGYNA